MEHKTQKISKTNLRLLERIFEWEIMGALPFQSKDKRYVELQKQGLVDRMDRVLGEDTVFSVKISGWCLTNHGRYVYCSNCK